MEPVTKKPHAQQQKVHSLVNSIIMEHVLQTEYRPSIEIMFCEFNVDMLMMKSAHQHPEGAREWYPLSLGRREAETSKEGGHSQFL